MTRFLTSALHFANQHGKLSFDAIRGALKCHVEDFLYRRPRDDLGISAPVGDGADGYAQMLRV